MSLRLLPPAYFERSSAADVLVDEIDDLFNRHGQQPCGVTGHGTGHGAVTALEHALQCAQLAEWARAPRELVMAALLHDIGHFLTPLTPLTPQGVACHDAVDDGHDELGHAYLATCLPPAVTAPVRLHVAAKRYLARTDDRYLEAMSPAERQLLWQQGGTMTVFESAEFEARPWHREAVQLRRWDDAARLAGRRTPTLPHYLGMLADLLAERMAERVDPAGVMAVSDAHDSR
jgi:predicted HD phosphohydrolase